MKLILSLLVFNVFSILACEVELPSHVLILSEAADFTQGQETKDCSPNDLEAMSATLKEVDGKVTAYQLQELMLARKAIVKIRPSMIQIQHLKNLARDQLILPSDIHLKSSRTHERFEYLTLGPGDQIEIHCPSCLYGLGQTLNLLVRNRDGVVKSLSITADFKKMVRAYRLTSFQPAFTSVPPQFLREEYVESIPHTDLVTDLSSLRFYKLNKPLRSGDLLRKSDLNAQNLVRAGLKTDVIIENSLIRLKTTGISRSNGTIGELVEVFHPQKNKKYQGKVIDNNKVLVEL